MNTLYRPAGAKAKISRQRIKKAAYWVSILEDEDISLVEEEQFHQWCALYPENKQAYEELTSVITRFKDVSDQEANAMNKVLQSLSGSSAIYRKSSVGVSLSVILGLYTWYSQSGYSTDYLVSDYRASTNEIREIILPDGSQITLDAMSSFNIKYSQNERRIELTQGRLFADVITNPARPFIVETPTATVKALGTQFSVNKLLDATKVTITESKVELCNKNMVEQTAYQLSCVRGQVGETMSLVDSRLYGPAASNVKADTAWMNHRLVVNDQPLSEVLNDLSRHYHGLMLYSGSDIKDVQVSGVYPTDNIQLSLSMLSKHPKLEVTQFSGAFHLFRKKRPLEN
jgi:transmembrane sensor